MAVVLASDNTLTSSPLLAVCLCDEVIVFRCFGSPRRALTRSKTMDLKQSLCLSLCRTKLSLYEARILVRIVEHGQVALSGLFLSEHLEHIQHTFKHEHMAIPVRDILADGSNDYKKVIDAAKSMASRNIEYWDESKKKWAFSSIIFDVTSEAGTIKFYVSNIFWDVLFDFTKGYSWYDLKIALTLPTPSAIRLYMLFNGLKGPFTYNVEMLKKMLQVDDKYNQTADFIKRIVQPAKEAMDQAGGNTFTFTRCMKGRKVTGITVTPVIRKAMGQQPADKEKFWAALIDKEIRMKLIYDCGFSARMLKPHADLIQTLAANPMADEILSGIIHRMRTGSKGRGWVINALRSELGFDIDGMSKKAENRNVK